MAAMKGSHMIALLGALASISAAAMAAPAPATTACSIALSGAVTAALPCTATAVLTFQNNMSAISVTATGDLPIGLSQVSFTTNLAGAPEAAAYSRDVVLDYSSVVAGTDTFIASKTAGTGSQSLGLTSVTPGVSYPDNRRYEVHGSLDSQLTSAMGTGAAVTAHVEF